MWISTGLHAMRVQPSYWKQPWGSICRRVPSRPAKLCLLRPQHAFHVSLHPRTSLAPAMLFLCPQGGMLYLHEFVHCIKCRHFAMFNSTHWLHLQDSIPLSAADETEQGCKASILTQICKSDLQALYIVRLSGYVEFSCVVSTEAISKA